jgi:hypothetical protein
MARLVVVVIMGAVMAGVITLAVMRAHLRRKAQVPELNQHPERLEQMLDETDDA